MVPDLLGLTVKGQHALILSVMFLGRLAYPHERFSSQTYQHIFSSAPPMGYV